MKCRTLKGTLLLRMVLLLLTGGAIINVAVAWGLALAVNITAPAGTGLRRPPDARIAQDGVGHVGILAGRGALESGWMYCKTGREYHQGSFHLYAFDSTRRGFWVTYKVWIDGLPFPSMRGEQWAGSDIASQNGCFGICTPDLLASTFQRRGCLGFTLIPQPLPFFGNTIFYAAILWLLFAAPGIARRRIRARRGQCPACAYPVGASDVCTECGAVVTRCTVR